MEEEVRTEAPPKKKRFPKMSRKAVLLLIAVALGIILIIVISVLVGHWRNNGKGFSEKLADQIGVSIETAQKDAHVKLQNASQYACINIIAGDYSYLYESKKSVKVSGVSVPEWVIYVNETAGNVSEVAYYDYKQLQKYGNGVKTKSHVETSGITYSMNPEAVQSYIGFAPLRTRYSTTGIQEAYKYYYKDQNSGNTVSYVLYVNYEDGHAVSAIEKENQFILSMLTLN